MDKKQLSILSDRFVNNLTWEKIGEKHGNTKQWAHQQYQNILSKIIYSDFYLKWLEKNKISQYADIELMDIILLIGISNKEKFINLINRFDIKDPKDILKLSKNDIISIKGGGQTFFYYLKLALLKYGLPYDDEDAESLLFKLTRERIQNSELGLRLRFKILHRDHFRCHYCGRSPRKDKEIILHVDHIVPLSRGGKWEESNWQS